MSKHKDTQPAAGRDSAPSETSSLSSTVETDSAESAAGAHAGSLAQRQSAENGAFRRLLLCVREYQDLLRRSTNVGPVTKGPHKEARLLRAMYEAAANAHAILEGRPDQDCQVCGGDCAGATQPAAGRDSAPPSYEALSSTVETESAESAAGATPRELAELELERFFNQFDKHLTRTDSALVLACALLEKFDVRPK